MHPLRRWREGVNASRSTFAAMIGISQRQLEAIEAGRKWPRWPILYAIVTRVARPNFVESMLRYHKQVNEERAEASKATL